MDTLGELVWWTVGEPTLPPSRLEALLAELRMGVAPPSRVQPADAFKRLASEARHEYAHTEDGFRVTLDLHPATGPDTMIVKHIVRTVSRDGVKTAVARVGECVFYRPERGKPKSARLRVSVTVDGLPDDKIIGAFANHLRSTYQDNLRHLDAQAYRRLVRRFLASVHALHLDGPYFVPNPVDAERLARLIDELGGGSRCTTMEVVNNESNRDTVARALGDTEDVPQVVTDTYLALDIAAG